ncbi:hypothetical protein HYW55_02250 [Candidatus Gottesmanbacteria bacterium]|nr:hypothetical protein [Candidatus Gottesmanbacteria bacterium]
MDQLNDLKIYSIYDQGHSYDSIHFLPQQCQTAWNDIKKLDLPDTYRDATSIVFCGMGGSAYGAHIIKNLYHKSLKIPLDIVSDYHLPAHVNPNTLLIFASYSGNTQETISCAEEAFRLPFEPKIIGISSGGKLEELMKIYMKPFYSFSQDYNPSMQPRLGQGYMQIGQIALLSTLGYLSVDDQEIKKLIDNLLSLQKEYEKKVPVAENKGKQYAEMLSKKIVNIIGGEFLSGAIHAIRNPFHETGKHFANYYLVPELNHHLMEGLKFPQTNPQTLLFFVLNSGLYSKEIDVRMRLTKDVIKKQEIEIIEYTAKLDTPLSQVFEVIQLGSYITFYLAMLHGVDPAQIPWVDYFKNTLRN